MENDRLNTIRHFRGSLQDFIDYWEQDRGVDTTPYKNVDYIYPKKRTEKDETIPYQTFNKLKRKESK
jgi:hypothetical protein